jgi:Tfp pilus assembly protein PilN
VSSTHLNLARQPFVNSRPLVRLTVLLWVAALALAGGNLWLYYQYLTGSTETRARLAEVEDATEASRRQAAELEGQLAAFGLGQQNDVVTFLNSKIDERTLAWGRLFDRLAALLPDDVRLLSLSPRAGDREGRRRGGSATAGERPRVELEIAGEAKTDEALLALIDALFRDPAFERPNPQRETRGKSGPLRFDLTVDYLPETEAALEAEAAAGEAVTAEAGAGEADEGEAATATEGGDAVPAAGAEPAEPAGTGVAATTGSAGGGA